MSQLSLEMQVWAGMAICAHHATLIYNDTPGNAASHFICNANLPPDHTNMAQQWNTEGANCAEVAGSNMRAYNWRTGSVCVKRHLHITSTVSVRWWNIISWKTRTVHGRNFLRLYLFFFFLLYIFCVRLPVHVALSDSSSSDSLSTWIDQGSTHIASFIVVSFHIQV